MKTTLAIYITMGVLLVAPLILFNIRKIWVKKPPDPVRFKPGRFTFITLATAFIVVFLVTAYQQTLKNRYEIAIERVAEQHAEAIVGNQSMEEFKAFVKEHGTDKVAASLETAEFPDYGDVSEARFQLSKWCIPKYWVDKEAFEQVETLGDENPVYIMYRITADDRQDFFALRMVNTEDGWKYDWFGNPTEEQRKIIKEPNEKNGKWFVVQKSQS